MIQALQRQWNETGYTPNSQKAQLQQEFNQIVNEHLDKLKIDLSHQTAGDGKSNLSPELVRRLRDEADKLKNEVATWENNLGFLANSKQAALLREEFDKKIQSARQRIALIEARLKAAKQNLAEQKKETNQPKKSKDDA